MTMRTLAALALLSAYLALPGCGATPEQSARHVVDSVAIGVDLADQVSAQQYTERARVALEASTSLVEYHAAVAPLDAVEQALRTAAAALHVADAAVRLWAQGGVSSWPQALSCLVGALRGIEQTFEAAGYPLPAELRTAIDLVHGMVDGDQCFADAGVPGGA